MRGARAPVGADGAAGAVGVDARLGRPRRGRPDPPADRALRGAARDPAPVGDAPGRRERDGARPGGSRWSARTGRWRCCSRARTCRDARPRRGRAGADGVERGGYVLWDSPGGDAPELILIATGAEVAPTLDGGAGARRRGRARARRLDALHGAVRSAGRGVPRAGAPARRCRRAWRSSRAPAMSWWKWVGDRGDVLGLDRFGASAPGTTVLEKLGFTAENIAARARALLESRRHKETTMPSDANASAAPLRARAERVGRLPLARVDPRRAPAGADRRLLRRRRHLEPDDLPEGDGARATPTTSSCTSWPRAARRRARSSGRWPQQDIARRLRPVPPGLGRGLGPRRLRLARGRPAAWPTTRSRPSARRCACTRRVDRPNLMVKIPATKPGLAAIEDVIAKGRSINVTLIFSLRRYAEVAESYMRGLERLVAEGGDPTQGRLGRELLRLAHRHRGRPAPGRDRRARTS